MPDCDFFLKKRKEKKRKEKKRKRKILKNEDTLFKS